MENPVELLSDLVAIDSTNPDQCVLTLERRILPGETPEGVEAELIEILSGISEQDPAFRAVVRRGLDRSPMETPPGAAVIPAIQAAAGQVLGRRVETAGIPYWTDTATLWAAGIPSVLFGPSGAGAHADEEWVDLDSVQACAEIYLQAALSFCQ